MQKFHRLVEDYAVRCKKAARSLYLMPLLTIISFSTALTAGAAPFVLVQPTPNTAFTPGQAIPIKTTGGSSSPIAVFILSQNSIRPAGGQSPVALTKTSLTAGTTLPTSDAIVCGRTYRITLGWNVGNNAIKATCPASKSGSNIAAEIVQQSKSGNRTNYLFAIKNSGDPLVGQVKFKLAVNIQGRPTLDLNGISNADINSGALSCTPALTAYKGSPDFITCEHSWISTHTKINTGDYASAFVVGVTNANDVICAHVQLFEKQTGNFSPVTDSNPADNIHCIKASDGSVFQF